MSCCLASHSSARATAASVADDPPKASTSAARRPSSRPARSVPTAGATTATSTAPGASVGSATAGGLAIGSSTTSSSDFTSSGTGSGTGSGCGAICTPGTGDSTTSVDRNETSSTTGLSRRTRTTQIARASSTTTCSDSETVNGGLRRTNSSSRATNPWASPSRGPGPARSRASDPVDAPPGSCSAGPASAQGSPPTSRRRGVAAEEPRGEGGGWGFIPEICQTCRFCREFHPWPSFRGPTGYYSENWIGRTRQKRRSPQTAHPSRGGAAR